MSRLLLGPVLRLVGSTDATVWVETDRPCVVEALGACEHTWSVAGHHYALVIVQGLTPGSATPYQVRLDDEVVWPPAGAVLPPSRVRTVAGVQPVRLGFGSCRYASAAAVGSDRRYGADALSALAARLVSLPEDQWPHALVLLGDQVYADETSTQVRERIRQRRDITAGAADQVADFEEYTWLYRESWTDPAVRWLLSTVPVSMIFDDHDVRDDWNISHAWRVQMDATFWWRERIIGALSSYWVYQHLGNLAPADLATNGLYQAVRACKGDAEPLLREFAVAADREVEGAKGTRWSYRRDFGPVRLLVLDSRCGRLLGENHRSMLSEPEWRWVKAQLPGQCQHLLLASSLPWLLPRGFHDLEAWNEQLCDGHRGGWLARVSEKLRRAADLEHWSAFRDSFDRLADLIADVAQGRYAGRPDGAPATICVLSGDVHHCYIAQADYGPDAVSRVYQLTCSPIHNRVPAPMKLAFRAAWSRAAERWTRLLLGVLTPVPKPGIDWNLVTGPHFGNQLMTLHVDGPRAKVVLEQAEMVNRQPELIEGTRCSLS